MELVELERVKKVLRKLPLYIQIKLLGWARAVERDGIRRVRLLKGYHDEPLQGDRLGQRSIRLSKSYRAIYVEEKNGLIHLIIVKEVNKHEY